MESQESNGLTHSGTGRWAPLYFAALAVAVWTPALFTSGYVLLGDMVFTPAMHAPVSLLGPVHGTMDVALIYNLAWLVSRLTGAVLLQKAVLFLIAFLPGYLMYRNVPATHGWSKVFAGTLYALNPFIYTRMLVGQWGFLLGYALLPVVYASCVKTFREPGAGRIARTALWVGGTALLSLHAGALALMVFFAVAILEMVRRPRAVRTAVSAVVILALFCAIGAFWLLPAVDGGGPGSSMGKADLAAFETRTTSRAGTTLSVLGLYGYWKTQLDKVMPRRYVPLWPAFGLLVLVLCLYGLWHYAGEPGRGPGLLALALLALLAFFLALGSRAPLTGGIFSFLYDHVAAFRLFREPQKFTALIALAYGVIGASGLDAWLSRRRGQAPSTASSTANGEKGQAPSTASSTANGERAWLTVVPVVLLALLAIYSFRMFGGLWGQARAVSYPRSWAQAQDLMERDKGDWYALYLPDFWYQRYEFTNGDQTITNPMQFYFPNRSLPLSSIEVGAVRLDRQALDDYVQEALASGKARGNMGAMLAPLNVRYILMARNPASVLFDYVTSQRDVEVVRQWKDLVLLKNRVPAARVSLAKHEGTFKSWGDVAKIAQGAMLTGSRILKDEATFIVDAQGYPLQTTSSSTRRITTEVPPDPVKSLIIGITWPTSLLVAEPYDLHWKVSGGGTAGPHKQLGVTMTFDAVPGQRATITYFNLLLVLGYAVSIAAALTCVLLVLYGAINERKAAAG